MVAIADYVREACNSPGTGTFNLAGTTTGRRTWTGTGGAFASGTQVYYSADDGNQWEEGIGTVTAGSPNTLSRDTVIENSLGTTARINFTGPVQVYCLGPPAKRTAFFTADNSALDFGSRRGTNLLAGATDSDALRVDQAGLIGIGTYSASGGFLVAALPSTSDLLRIDLRGVVPSVSHEMYLRISVDGGSTFLQGSGEYISFILYSAGSSASTYSLTSSYAQISATLPAFPATGYVELDPATKLFSGVIFSNGTINVFTGNWSNASAPTHLLIGFVGASISTGRAKVSRRPFA